MKKNNVKIFLFILLKAIIDAIKKSIIDNKEIFKSFPYYNENEF